MHPILFRIPVPGGKVSLLTLLLVAAGIAALFAVIAVARKNRQGAQIPGLVAAALAAGGYYFKDTIIEGPLPIYAYGVMLGLSLFVGWFITLSLAERDGLPRDVMADNYVVTALAALAGSRVLYILTNLSEFQDETHSLSLSLMINIRRGGLVAYGGFLGGLFGSIAYLRSKNLPLLPWADVAVPSLASGLMITRIGCYLFGCDFGRQLPETASAFLKKAGTFPHWDPSIEGGNGSPAWAQQVKNGLVPPDALHSLPVHPTQLYESLTGFVLLVLLLSARRWQKFRGQIFLLFFFAYGYLRFLLEILRDDSERGFLSLTMPPHVLYPLALAALGIGYAVSFAAWIPKDGFRKATQAIAIGGPLALWFWMRPESFSVEQAAVGTLSTSQVVALVTGVGACLLFAVYWRVSIEHPEQAMALDLPPEYTVGEEKGKPNPALLADDEDDAEEDEEKDDAADSDRAPKKPEKKAAKDEDDEDEGEDEPEPAEQPSAKAEQPAAKPSAKAEKSDDESDEDEPAPKKAEPASKKVAPSKKKKRRV